MIRQMLRLAIDAAKVEALRFIDALEAATAPKAEPAPAPEPVAAPVAETKPAPSKWWSTAYHMEHRSGDAQISSDKKADGDSLPQPTVFTSPPVRGSEETGTIPRRESAEPQRSCSVCNGPINYQYGGTLVTHDELEALRRVAEAAREALALYDETWPSRAGDAPDVAKLREALSSLSSSNGDRNG